MTASTEKAPEKAGGPLPVFTLTRTLNAPRALVFKAFSEKEHLARWWGPKGLTWLSGTLDFRPGGMFHYGMRSPQGQEMWGRFIYKEIDAPSRVVFINSFSDPQGGLTRHPMAPDWPLEMLNEWTFTEKDGKTILNMRGSPYNATPEECAVYEQGFKSMEGGFGATLDQFDAYLAELQGDKK